MYDCGRRDDLYRDDELRIEFLRQAIEFDAKDSHARYCTMFETSWSSRNQSKRRVSLSLLLPHLEPYDHSQVVAWHLDFLRQTAIDPIPSHDELFTTLSTLHSLKLIATESQRLDYFQKVRSLVEDSDLFLALKEEPLLKKHVPRFAS